jgi:hypothetical protein
LREDNITLRGIVALNLGGAYWMSGDLASANETLAEAITASRRADNAFAALLAMRELAELEVMGDACIGQPTSTSRRYGSRSSDLLPQLASRTWEWVSCCTNGTTWKVPCAT